MLSDISYTVKFHGIVYALEENDSLKLVARFEPLFAKQMECNTVYQAAFVKNNKVFDAVVVCNRAPTEMILPEYTLLLANNSAINIVDENKSVVLPVGKVIVEYRKVKLINWMLQMR